MPPSLDRPALDLILFDDPFVVYKIAAQEDMPAEILNILTQSYEVEKDLVSITRTLDEISVVCRVDKTPKTVDDVPRWRCIKFTGPLDFGLTGILCDLTTPLKEAGISIFAISTWYVSMQIHIFNTDRLDDFERDTDYVLVPEVKVEDAVKVLKSDGWTFNDYF